MLGLGGRCGRTRRGTAPLLGQRPAASRPDGVPHLQRQRVGELDRPHGVGLRGPWGDRLERDRAVPGRARHAAGLARRGAARTDAGTTRAEAGVRRPGRRRRRGRRGGARRRAVRAGLPPGRRRVRGHQPHATGAPCAAPGDLGHHQRADRRQRGVGVGGGGGDDDRAAGQRGRDGLVGPGRCADHDGGRLGRVRAVHDGPGSRRTSSRGERGGPGGDDVAGRGARPCSAVAQRAGRGGVRAARDDRHPHRGARAGPARDVRCRPGSAQRRARRRRGDGRGVHGRADRRAAAGACAGRRGGGGRRRCGPRRPLAGPGGRAGPHRGRRRGQAVLRRCPPHLRPAPAARPPAVRGLRPPGVDHDGRARRGSAGGPGLGDRAGPGGGVHGRRRVPADRRDRGLVEPAAPGRVGGDPARPAGVAPRGADARGARARGSSSGWRCSPVSRSARTAYPS